MELEIRQKIITALAGVTVAGGKHFDRLPDEAVTDPYLRFWMVANFSTRDTVRRYEEYLIQFDVFEKSVSPVNVETIGNDIYDAMDGAVFTLTNWWTSDIYCVHRPRIISADENNWQSFVEVIMKFEHK